MRQYWLSNRVVQTSGMPLQMVTDVAITESGDDNRILYNLKRCYYEKDFIIVVYGVYNCIK